MQRCSLAEIREKTYKPVDAWWTVALVDPLASRLVRLVAPYRWITPNRLTGVAMLLGLGAAVCFARQSPGWLIAGALLFHVGFIVDCMDGKIARLNGTGSLFGAWVDFMFDRLRAIICAAALMGGQYARTGEVVYLWLATAVVSLDLLRYLNSAQMGKVRAVIRQERPVVAEPAPAPPRGTEYGRRRLKSLLRSRRIRTHLVSGIEFEMAVFIIGPLTGWVIGTTVVAGALLTLFELRLVYYLWRATRQHVEWQRSEVAGPPALVRGEAPAPAHLLHRLVAEPGGVRREPGQA
jgi:phosphatidylglycerophosphate synthase